MRTLALTVLLVLVRPGILDAACPDLVADGGGGAIHEAVATWPERDQRLLLDEYAYVRAWRTHENAVAAGFAYGDTVYGEALVPQGVFDARKAANWKRAYAKSRRPDYRKRLAPTVAPSRIDHALVATLLTSCLRAGPWVRLTILDECRVTFSAGYRGDGTRATPPSPTRLHATGARCQRFPEEPLSAAAASVQCIRSGTSPVEIMLETSDGNMLKRNLPPPSPRSIPQEPVLAGGESKPATEVVTVYRSRDFKQMGVGVGCPSCGLYAADVRPSMPGAKILDIGVVSSIGSPHWYRCPAGYRCGVPEFSPPEQRNISGCFGQTSCRVWRLSDDAAEAQDTIQIAYETQQPTCMNCPEGMDYAAARERWEKEIALGAAGCQVFPDTPPQVFPR